MDKPHNKKSPEGPHQSKRAEPEYPWVSGHSDINGRYKLVYADPDKPEKSFVEELHHDGSFTIHETLKDEKGLKNTLFHHERKYGKSKSTHIDDNYDLRAYNQSSVVDKEYGLQGGGAFYKGFLGGEVDAISGSTKSRKGSKGSKQNSFHSTAGDGSHLYEGNYFSFYGKDHGHSVDGSYYGMFSGEHGQYIKGNSDTFSEKKIRLASNGAMALTTSDTGLFNTEKAMTIQSSDTGTLKTKKDLSVTSNAEITINADTKITIKVGSSKIEISDGQITIKGSAIKFEQG